MGSELLWEDAVVAISSGENMLRWRPIAIPNTRDHRLLYPETAIVRQKDRLRKFLGQDGLARSTMTMQYIIYSQGKEDCALSNIPVEALHSCRKNHGEGSTGSDFLN